MTKRLKVTILTTTLLLCLMFVLSGCIVVPWFARHDKLKFVVWQSQENNDDIYMEIKVFENDVIHFGTIEFQDTRYDFSICWTRSIFSFYDVNYYGEPNDVADERKYVDGDYKIIKDDCVELTISKDMLFNNALVDKKIVIKAEPMTESDYDVALRQRLGWKLDGVANLYTYEYTRRFSTGNIKIDNVKYDIIIYWLEDNAFKAYEFANSVQQENTLFTGTYSSDKENLQLNCTFDNTAQTQTYNLTAYKLDNSENVPKDKLWYPEV